MGVVLNVLGNSSVNREGEVDHRLDPPIQSVDTRVFWSGVALRHHRESNSTCLAATVSKMRIGCADCGCIVDSGVRVVPCGTPDCCCLRLPLREAAETHNSN